MLLPRKLWFKWQRVKTFWRHAWGRKEQPAYDASLRMCPNCRGLIDRRVSVCPLCGAFTRPARSRGGSAPGRVMGVIPIPRTATSALVGVNILLYAVSWYMTQKAAAAVLSAAPAWGGIDNRVLVSLGAKFGPAIYAGQWWRLVTAVFLHAGLLHLGMNLWVLLDVGPMTEALFSASKFIVVYLASGVAGFLLSLWWSPFVVSIGASGAIMGLIGALIGASFHHGTLGKEFRGRLWRWVIYILIFGLFFAVDNAAHVGGLVTGLLFGYLVPEGEPESGAAETLWSLLGTLAVLIIAGSFALMALHLSRITG